MTGREHTTYQQGIINRYYEHKDTIALQRLGEVVSDLYLAEGKKKEKLWDSARGALMKIAASDPRVIAVLRERSVEKLATLVGELNAEASRSGASPQADDAEPPASAPAVSEPAAHREAYVAPTSSALTPENLKSAMKAFRKRLKLTRLDDESRLARSPMSSGKSSQIKAIMPPREFTREVWDELVRQGKLKPAGAGFYELAE